jgi:uncharacterized protein
MDSWLPIGFMLPGDEPCGMPLHEGPDWLIVSTENGRALIAKGTLHEKWAEAGLVDVSAFGVFFFGPTRLFAIASGADQTLAPVDECRSPNSKGEALAFALALKATREVDAESPLQNAIYAQKLGRLLPIYGIAARDDDSLVLGRWLTGGAPVSAKAARRLRQIMNWLGEANLNEVVAASGVRQLARSGPDQASDDDRAPRQIHDDDMEPASGLEGGGSFQLPGRPLLEAFFNEHVVEIVRDKARYAALGVGFPSAIVLHGPTGCGKTFAVEQLVEFLGWPSFEVDASSVASPYIHETSRKVAQIFDKAMDSAPSVLVIDEMEAFLADRESGSGSSHHRVEEVAEFLRRIPEAAKNEVLIVGMTNRLEMIDPAIMRRGRFDHVIAVEMATEEEVKTLLDKLLTELPKAGDVDAAPLAKELAGRPLSDVAFVVREGARLSARAGLSEVRQSFLVEALRAAASRAEHGKRRRIGF